MIQCPKCGSQSKDINKRYVSGQKEFEEYLKCECLGCGYDWQRPTEEQKKKEQEAEYAKAMKASSTEDRVSKGLY